MQLMKPRARDRGHPQPQRPQRAQPWCKSRWTTPSWMSTKMMMLTPTLWRWHPRSTVPSVVGRKRTLYRSLTLLKGMMALERAPGLPRERLDRSSILLRRLGGRRRGPSGRCVAFGFWALFCLLFMSSDFCCLGTCLGTLQWTPDRGQVQKPLAWLLSLSTGRVLCFVQ